MLSLCQCPECMQTTPVVLFAEQVVFSYQREVSYVLKDWLVYLIGKGKQKQKQTNNNNKKTPPPQTFIMLLVFSYSGAEMYRI